MDKKMRLFAGEFITGGGLLAGQSPDLAHEGDMMVQALLQDLLDAGYENIVCPRVPGLPPLTGNIETVDPGQDFLHTWRQVMQTCATAWLIAPESGEVLYQLTQMAKECGCISTGCSLTAVALATSKSRTNARLIQHKIPALPSWHDADTLEKNSTGWVIKPDDGAGAEGCYRFNDLAALRAYIDQAGPENCIVQEYLPGIPASLTLLCHQGQSRLLACNEQLFSFEAAAGFMKGHLHGIVVNGLRQYAHECAAIAAGATQAIPGLAGIAGIDLIITPQGPVVVEVNPRLTTAYVGLHESIGLNPAALVLETLQSGSLPELGEVKYQPVTVRF